MKALLLLFLLTLGCAEAMTGPAGKGAEVEVFEAPTFDGKSFPMLITRILPPMRYARWYHNAEDCVGLPGRFYVVKWYTMSASYRTPSGGSIAGLHAHGTIILSVFLAGDSSLVQHEAMHHILELNGFRPRVPAGIGLDSAEVLTHPRTFRGHPAFGPCTGD